MRLPNVEPLQLQVLPGGGSMPVQAILQTTMKYFTLSSLISRSNKLLDDVNLEVNLQRLCLVLLQPWIFFPDLGKNLIRINLKSYSNFNWCCLLIIFDNCYMFAFMQDICRNRAYPA